ncbi:MAG: hypothetical protein JNL70_21605 [Saprospiraceae bacterium]|nr:hypothetical protein [Saprospiraceae bacterium]
MKVLSIFLVIIALLCAQNTSFATVISHNAQNNVAITESYNVSVKKHKKPSFAAKIIEKAAAKIAEKGKSDMSQGDKLATMGFWGVIGSIALSTLASVASGGAGIPGALSALISIISLVGLILCIVALTRDDLSAKGKKLAKWGIGIFLTLLVLALIIIVAAIAALGV